LLKDDYCGYCERVVRAIDKLGLEVERIDTRADAQAARDHRTKTGRSTVPCLYIDEIPLFESDDIMDWLEAYNIAGGAGET
jgi:glutaredoxin